MLVSDKSEPVFAQDVPTDTSTESRATEKQETTSPAKVTTTPAKEPTAPAKETTSPAKEITPAPKPATEATIDPAFYKNTSRFSFNYIWAPIARIDLGAEFLFGSRTNQNGDTGKAKQLQLSAKFRY